VFHTQKGYFFLSLIVFFLLLLFLSLQFIFIIVLYIFMSKRTARIHTVRILLIISRINMFRFFDVVYDGSLKSVTHKWWVNVVYLGFTYEQ
jgi:hypothetical protein